MLKHLILAATLFCVLFGSSSFTVISTAQEKRISLETKPAPSDVRKTQVKVDGKHVSFSLPDTYREQTSPLAWVKEGGLFSYEVFEGKSLQEIRKKLPEKLLARSLKLQGKEEGVRKVFNSTIDEPKDGTSEWYYVYYSIADGDDALPQTLLHAARFIPLSDGKFIMLEYREQIEAKDREARARITVERREIFLPAIRSLKVE